MKHSESDRSENELFSSQQIQNNLTGTPACSSSMFCKNDYYMKLLKFVSTAKNI